MLPRLDLPARFFGFVADHLDHQSCNQPGLPVLPALRRIYLPPSLPHSLTTSQHTFQ